MHKETDQWFGTAETDLWAVITDKCMHGVRAVFSWQTAVHTKKSVEIHWKTLWITHSWSPCRTGCRSRYKSDLRTPFPSELWRCAWVSSADKLSGWQNKVSMSTSRNAHLHSFFRKQFPQNTEAKQEVVWVVWNQTTDQQSLFHGEQILFPGPSVFTLSCRSFEEKKRAKGVGRSWITTRICCCCEHHHWFVSGPWADSLPSVRPAVQGSLGLQASSAAPHSAREHAIKHGHCHCCIRSSLRYEPQSSRTGQMGISFSHWAKRRHSHNHLIK